MQKSNNTIPYIGVILSDLPERKESILKELREQGIWDKVDFFPAIHDKKSVASGISKAHKQIIRVAQMCKLESVIVLEDDCRFMGEGAFDEFLRQCPESYDIFLGGIYTGVIDEDNKTKAFSGFHCYRVAQRYYQTFLEADEEQHIDRAQAWKGEFYVCNPFIAIQWNGFSHQTRKEENYDPLLRGRQFFNDYIKID